MSDVNLFFYAAKNKVRFKAPNVNGLISTEDLFSLNENALREIGIALYNKVNENGGPFAKPTPATDRAKIEMQIVQAVLDHKATEAKRKADAAALRSERNRLLEIRERKQAEQLNALDLAEIDKRLAAYDAAEAAATSV